MKEPIIISQCLEKEFQTRNKGSNEFKVLGEDSEYKALYGETNPALDMIGQDRFEYYLNHYKNKFLSKEPNVGI